MGQEWPTPSKSDDQDSANILDLANDCGKLVRVVGALENALSLAMQRRAAEPAGTTGRAEFEMLASLGDLIEVQKKEVDRIEGDVERLKDEVRKLHRYLMHTPGRGQELACGRIWNHSCICIASLAEAAVDDAQNLH